MFRFLVLVSLSNYALGFSLPPTLIKGIGQGRIVGGDEADITDAPWQVSLEYDVTGSGGYSLRCGGSIISSDVVITAAHCISDSHISHWRVRAGSSLHASGGEVFAVDNYVVHNSYNTQIDYDVALLWLSRSVSVDNSTIQIIPLPSQDQVVADGSLALVTGWGSTSSGGSAVNILRKVTIPVVNQDICAAAYASYNPITPRMICGGIFETGGKDACQGDSGGPFVINNVLIGITSWGRGCALAGYPGVWTRVPALRDWINEQL